MAPSSSASATTDEPGNGPGPERWRSARSTASRPTARFRPTTRIADAGGGALQSIYAYGFAQPLQPWTSTRATWSTCSINDVGEVDVGGSEPRSAPGANFGWAPCMKGPNDGAGETEQPVYAYRHSRREPARSLAAFLIPDGGTFPIELPWERYLI